MSAQKVWLLSGALVCFGLTALALSPIRYRVFPPKLTIAQRAILDRAEAGLAIYATRSATARALYNDSKRFARRTVFIPGIGIFGSDSLESRPLAVAIQPEGQTTVIANYSSVEDLVLFVEPRCDSMSHVGLGLVYGHELTHRHDFFSGVYRSSDSANSVPRRTTELNARQATISILFEFTEGRWDSAVVAHVVAYRRLPLSRRLKNPHGRVFFDFDERWIRKEFGRITPNDLKYLSALLQFDSGLRMAQADTTLNPAEVQEQLILVLRTF